VSSHGQRDEWITHDRGNLIHPCGLAKDFLSNDSGVRACVLAFGHSRLGHLVAAST
jgi:hypothetical protein